jgi:hypothetical protein
VLIVALWLQLAATTAKSAKSTFGSALGAGPTGATSTPAP